MHASTLTRAASMALAAVMLILISGLAGTELPAPTEGQKTQVGLAKAKAAQGDKMAAFQTCKAQDRAATSYQASSKAAHTQPDASCVDSGLSVTPMPVASAPASTARG